MNLGPVATILMELRHGICRDRGTSFQEALQEAQSNAERAYNELRAERLEAELEMQLLADAECQGEA